MLSSLFRSKNSLRPRVSQRSLFSSPFSDRPALSNKPRRAANGRRRVAADFDDEGDHEDGEPDEDEDVNEEDENEDEEEEDVEEDEDEDDNEGITPLLPLFEASHLGLNPRSFCMDRCP